ncbi:MAG: glycerophosphodiester phosphodiesterase family protein [Acidobacteriota bacterium]
MPLANDRQSALDPCRPLVIAHRGASGLAPENTVAAFKLAVALGADGVEMDVQLSSDGTPVVIHDARVNRTTDGSGNVARLTLAQLQDLDAGSWFERRLSMRPRVRAMVRRFSAETGDSFRTFSREPVPTLEVVLSLLAPAGLGRIYVELKGGPAKRRALLEAVLSVVRALRLERNVTLLSFDHAIVRSAKEIAGDIRTAATFPAKGRRLISTRSIVRAAESAGVDEVALHFGLASRRAVDALHERGISVSAWTANSKLAMRRLAACGVDSIMTNFPNRLRGVLDSLSPGPISVLSRRRRGRE